jgi:hypothetical protein
MKLNVIMLQFVHIRRGSLLCTYYVCPMFRCVYISWCYLLFRTRTDHLRSVTVSIFLTVIECKLSNIQICRHTRVAGTKIVPSRSSGWLTPPPSPPPCVVASSSPRSRLLFSCIQSLDRIKCYLFPCSNTAFIGSDFDGTIFLPATVAASAYRQICKACKESSSRSINDELL